MIEIQSALAVLQTEAGLLLMLKRRDDDRSYPSKWGFPGGRTDEGEDSKASVIREIFEEVGIRENKILNIEYAGEMKSPLPSRNRIYVIHIYMVSVPNIIEVKLSEEHSDMAFLTPEDALGLELAGSVTESLIRGLLKYGEE